VVLVELLKVMVTIEPELVRVAVPVTVQLAERLHDPVAVTVALVSVELPLLVVVKVMLPGTTIVAIPLQVSENVKLIV